MLMLSQSTVDERLAVLFWTSDEDASFGLLLAGTNGGGGCRGHMPMLLLLQMALELCKNFSIQFIYIYGLLVVLLQYSYHCYIIGIMYYMMV